MLYLIRTCCRGLKKFIKSIKIPGLPTARNKIVVAMIKTYKL